MYIYYIMVYDQDEAADIVRAHYVVRPKVTQEWLIRYFVDFVG